MLTLETLAARLRTWSARHRANARADVSPIQLYQELFALTHELKSSVQLTEDTAVQALDPVITESDARLRQLAYDELELAPADNAALRKLAGALDALESLGVLLATAEARAHAPTAPAPGDLPVLKLPYTWDQLSRARARSCARHGYRFARRTDSAALTELASLDEALGAELRKHGGLIVARGLDALPAAEPSATTMQLSVATLGAFPPGGATAPPAGWSAV